MGRNGCWLGKHIHLLPSWSLSIRRAGPLAKNASCSLSVHNQPGMVGLWVDREIRRWEDGMGGGLSSAGKLNAGSRLCSYSPVPAWPQASPLQRTFSAPKKLELPELPGLCSPFSGGSKVATRHQEGPAPPAPVPNLHLAFASAWPSLSSPSICAP